MNQATKTGLFIIAMCFLGLAYIGDGVEESAQMAKEKRMAVYDKTAHAAYQSGLRFNKQ